MTLATRPTAAAALTRTIRVSILVPAKDEAENLPRFLALCAEMIAAQSVGYEVVVIDDGSRDATPSVLAEAVPRYPFLRVVTHRTQRGIADALRSGYLAAQGDILVFYPADLQFLPADIPRLCAPILADEADMVTGYKQGKYEKAFVSGIYNTLSRALFEIPVRDLNNVKAYRRTIMADQPVRPDWHRYMIVLAHAQGYSVKEIPVALYPRTAGRSKFGFSRIPVGVLDMLAVWFELRFGQKPLLAFGMLGVGLFALGVLAGLIALGILFTSGFGVRWVWTIIQTSLILGSIFFAAGLLGEQVAVLRAEQRELRRRLDERSDRHGAA
jgi:glycosyltransferase involved in cell wall biosynthesis